MRGLIAALIIICFAGDAQLQTRQVRASDVSSAKKTASPAPRRRALLVGVSSYCRGSNKSQCVSGKKYWWNLNSGPDVEALKHVLKDRFEFDEIKILQTREETTHKNIVNTFRAFLINQTNKGDIVYFHFSGHGSQVPDDKNHGINLQIGDEIDGFDECLVPSDYISQENGSNNIRDDEIAQLLAELKLKKPANVTVTMDSCFSGSNTRGGSALVRGGRWGGIAPASSRSMVGKEDSPSGLFAQGEDTLQGHVVLSASRHDQLANETVDDVTGQSMGMFTYALVRALEKAEQTTTYRDVLERVVDMVTRGNRNQEPQFEGNSDTLLMSGVPVRPPQPHIGVQGGDGKVVLQAGRLHGMTPKSQFSIYAINQDMKTTQPIAQAQIESVGLTTSSLKIISPQLTDELVTQLRTGRAVETLHSFGDIRLKVAMPPNTSLSDTSGVMNQVRRLDLINPDVKETEKWDVRICRDNCPDETFPPGESPAQFKGGLTLQRSDGSVIARVPGGDDAAEKIRIALEGESRWQFVKSLHNESESKASLKIRLVPVTDVKVNPKTGLSTSARRVGIEVRPTAGGQLELLEGDYVMLEIMNMSSSDVWVSVLDLNNEGGIGPLWPHPDVAVGQSGENLIPGAPDGKPVWTLVPLPFVIEMTKPYGWDTIKAIATRSKTNFSHLFQQGLSESIQRGQTRGRDEAQTPLGQLLMTATTGLSKTRSGVFGADPANVAVPPDWTTATVTFIVEPRK